MQKKHVEELLHAVAARAIVIAAASLAAVFRFPFMLLLFLVVIMLWLACLAQWLACGWPVARLCRRGRPCVAVGSVLLWSGRLWLLR